MLLLRGTFARRESACSHSQPVPCVRVNPLRRICCKDRTPKGRGYRVAAATDEEITSSTFTGEDAAAFSFESQTTESWTRFFAVLGVVGAVLVYLILGTDVFDRYVGAFEEVLVEPQYAIVGMLMFFALFHSGLAYLRPYGEQLIGARAWRVLFASISLPLATVALFYFINHRYDGTPLWDIRAVPGVHTSLWVANFVSFLFLYPSTFNLLEVAAVDKPVLHMWETGIARITRHPQAWGQLLWCLAHTAWIGNSFMVWTSLALCAHHAFGCWHGDLRLRRQYGEAFDALAVRTSIVPFAAILDGRQQLPKDYWREFVRVPYAGVVAFTLGTYFAHPYMQLAAYALGW